MAKNKVETRKNSKASLKEIVGAETYALWLDMLKRLVPEGRTHRLSVVVAGMLQYATNVASEKEDELADNDAANALASFYDNYDGESESELLKIVQRMFKDAGVEYERVSRKGEHYNIAEEALREFAEWFNYPWD